MSQTKIIIILSSVFAILILVYLIISSVSSNSGTGNPIQKPVVLNYTGIQMPEEVMNTMLVEYKKIKPNVTIKYTKKNYDNLLDYRSFVIGGFKTKTAGNIIEINQNWVPFLDAQMNANNEFFVGDDFKNTFFNVFKSSCLNSEIKTICVPITYDGLVLAYNKDMFASAGLVPPTTWEDLRESALKLTKRNSSGAIEVSGAALGTTNNISNASDIIVLMLLQSQVKIPNDLDTEVSATAFEYYSNFYKRDKVWNENMPDSIKAFAIQKTAMAFVRYDQMKQILDLNPTISMGLALPPQLPLKDGGLTSNYISSNWVEMVSNDSSKEQQKEAWAFLKWLSSPDQQKKMSLEYSKYIKFGNLYSAKSLKSDKTIDPNFGKPFMDTADKSSWSIFTSNSGMDDFMSIITDLSDQVSKSGSGSDYQIFKSAEDKIKQKFQKGL